MAESKAARLTPEVLDHMEALRLEADESVGPLHRDGAYTPAIERFKAALDSHAPALIAAARGRLAAEKLAEALRFYADPDSWSWPADEIDAHWATIDAADVGQARGMDSSVGGVRARTALAEWGGTTNG